MVPAKSKQANTTKASVKKKSKRRSKKNPLPYTKTQLRKLINQSPLHLEHKNAQKLLMRLLNRMERMTLSLKKLDENLLYETKRTAQLITSMRQKKTATAKNSVKRARQRLSNCRIKHRAKHAAFKELISEIKFCLKEIRYFEKKESAKQTAIQRFIQQWEKDYDKKVPRPQQ